MNTDLLIDDLLSSCTARGTALTDDFRYRARFIQYTWWLRWCNYRDGSRYTLTQSRFFDFVYNDGPHRLVSHFHLIN